MKTRIVDRETGEMICEVVTNHSMSFDEVARLGGLEWKTYEDDDVESDGWYDGDVLVTQEVAEIETVS